jgi:transcriptional regulator with GAF, ATPase, and Fis domain
MQRNDEENIQNAERLAALQGTSLLDSPPEEAFDRLTRLATTLLHVPVALVSLVDVDRQFFKSCVGLPEPLASLRQTPLTHSFCKHVVASGEPLIVSDIRDSEFKDNPSVFGIGEIAYTGIPLTTTEGHALGSFCVADTKPRKWTEEEIQILRSLASSAMTEIATRRMAQELRELSNDLQRLVEVRTCQLSHLEERWRVLLQVNNALVTCLDRETLLEAIARALGGVIPYDRMALVLADPGEDGFKVLSAPGPESLPPAIPITTTWPRHGSRCGFIAESDFPADPGLRDDSRFVEHGPLIRGASLHAVP